MFNREELRYQWDMIKKQLLQNWRELSDSEFAGFHGTPNELIAAIQYKTGASWNEVEAFIKNALHDVKEDSRRTGGLADRYGGGSSEFVRAGFEQLAASSGEYSRKLAQTINRRPVESVAIAFGFGLLAGAALLFGCQRR